MTKFTKLFQRVRAKVKRNYFMVYNVKCELNVKLHVRVYVYIYILYVYVYIHTYTYTHIRE